jgi:EmrB/QacA subfamily drug resistance transporter
VNAAVRIGRHGMGGVLLAVSVAHIVVVLDYYSLTVALPRMAHTFGVATTNLQWVISAYMLAFASVLVVGGRIGDQIGRKRALLLGIAIFGTASLCAGLAPGPEVVVVFRVVQGCGAALIFPVGLAAVADAVPGDRSARAIGILMGVTSLGNAIGPFVGGVLTQAFGWRSVFLVNVPIALVAAGLVWWGIDESERSRERLHLDLRGCLLLAAGIVTLTVGVDRIEAFSLAGLAVTIAAAVAFFAAFVMAERRSRAPLIDVRLFKRRSFREILISGCLCNFGWAIAVFSATLSLQQVRGLSPLEAGAAFLAMSAGSAVGGPLAGRLTGKVPARAIMLAASAASALGLLWLSLQGALVWFLVALALTGLAVGVAYSATTIATIAAVPAANAGAATGATMTAMVTTAAIAVATAGVTEEFFAHVIFHPREAGVAAALRLGACAAIVAVGLLTISFLRGAPRDARAPDSAVPASGAR